MENDNKDKQLIPPSSPRIRPRETGNNNDIPDIQTITNKNADSLKKPSIGNDGFAMPLLRNNHHTKC